MTSLAFQPMNKKQIYALGFFDGVHLGHQALLRECLGLARERGCTAAAITFQCHPSSLFTQTPPPLINTDADRIRLLRQQGMTTVRSLPVVEEVMATHWETFLLELVEDGGAGFVCGSDFRFGHLGRGDGEKLQDFCARRGLPCIIVEEQTLDGIRISSTHIRTLLEAGDIAQANRFLGHGHILTGTVVPGHQLGRRLGVPTANLRLPQELVVPRFGVYACRAAVDGRWYPAVTNLGVRPTVSGEGITVEPWILDYTGDLYGREITLEFREFLRPEEKFPDLESLKEEILCNARQTRQILEECLQSGSCTNNENAV